MLIKPLKTIVACAVLTCCAIPNIANAQFAPSVRIKFSNFDAESHPGNDDLIRQRPARIDRVESRTWVAYNNVDFGDGANSIQVKTASVGAGGALIFTTGAPFNQPGQEFLGYVHIPEDTGLDVFENRLDVPVSGVVDTLYVTFSGDSNTPLFDLKSFNYANSDVGQDIMATSFDEESAPDDRKTIRDAGTKVSHIRATAPIEYWSYKNFQFGNGASTVIVRASSNTRGGTLSIKSGDPISGPVLGTVEITNTGGWNNFLPFFADLDEDLVRMHRGKDLYFVITDESGSGYQFDIESFRFDDSLLYLQNLINSLLP